MPGTVALHEDVSQISCERPEGIEERECTVYLQESWAGDPSHTYDDVANVSGFVDESDQMDMEFRSGSSGDTFRFDEEGVNCRVHEVGGEDLPQHYYTMKCGVGFGE